LLSQKGTMLHTFSDTSEAGLNFIEPKLAMKEKESKILTRELGRKKSNPEIPHKAEDGNFYFPVGKYKLEITLASGRKETRDFEITLK